MAIQSATPLLELCSFPGKRSCSGDGSRGTVGGAWKQSDSEAPWDTVLRSGGLEVVRSLIIIHIARSVLAPTMIGTWRQAERG